MNVLGVQHCCEKAGREQSPASAPVFKPSSRAALDLLCWAQVSPQGREKVKLSVQNHDRDRVGLTYVYPVVSRRAGGVSVGINLNPNNACNWACVYCQVPNLSKGKAPHIDRAQLRRELMGFLQELLHGDFMEQKVPESARVLKDIALSGNGEPTSAQAFDQIIEVIGEVMRHYGLVGKIPLVLISNGSLTSQEKVQRGLSLLGELGGECWYKLDSVNEARRLEINQARAPMHKVAEQLSLVAERCRLRLQCCLFQRDGQGPSSQEMEAYGRFVRAQLDAGTKIQDILLYGLARPSLQPGAERLARLSPEQMQDFGQQLRDRTGLPVQVHA